MKGRTFGCVLSILLLFAAAAAGGEQVRVLAEEARAGIAETARLWRLGEEKAAEARFRDARDGFEAGRCFLELLVHREELSRAEEKFAAVGEAIADGGKDVRQELAALDKILEEIAESDRLSLGRVF